MPDKTIVNTRKLFPQITDKGMIVDETIVRKKMAEKDKKESEGAKVARDFIARSVEMEVPSSLEFLPWSLCFSCIITEEAQSWIETKARIFGKAWECGENQGICKMCWSYFTNGI